MSVALLIVAPSRPRVSLTVSRCLRSVSVATGGQPTTVSGALTLATAPLWAMKCRHVWRAPWQTSLWSVSGEFAPPVNDRSKRSSGTSGIPPNTLWSPWPMSHHAEQRQGHRAGQVQRQPGSEPVCGIASVTGLVSAVGSSGVAAVAVPIRDARRAGAGREEAGGHALASRDRLMPIAFGSPTSAPRWRHGRPAR